MRTFGLLKEATKELREIFTFKAQIRLQKIHAIKVLLYLFDFIIILAT